MIRPPYLKEGDTVAIVSTARKVSKFEIKPAIDLLKSWGLEVQTGKNLYKEDNQFAGTDEDRTGDLQRALNNKNVQAVLFARGGYGTVRVIDNIDWKKFIKQPPKKNRFSPIYI